MKKISSLFVVLLFLAGMNVINAQQSVTAPQGNHKTVTEKHEKPVEAITQPVVTKGKSEVKQTQKPQSTTAAPVHNTKVSPTARTGEQQVITKSGQTVAGQAEAAQPKSSAIDYMKKEVYPVMRTERLKMEKALSADDKAKLVNLRQAYKEARGSSELISEADFSSHATMDKDQAAKIGDIRRQVMTIGSNYSQQLNEAMTVINGKKNEWKSGLEKASGVPAKTVAPSNTKGKPGVASERNPIDVVSNPFIFLLWDAELPATVKKSR
ncbi:MAG: hypothetical protein KKD74_04070 [Bacteroidetes bacterium]|nr:hypothetical protein [Bacteroidota bacterium]